MPLPNSLQIRVSVRQYLSYVLCIQVISSTDVHEQNINTRALNAQPTCISRYHSFIKKTDTAAIITEYWGGIAGYKRHGQGSHVLLTFKFPDK